MKVVHVLRRYHPRVWGGTESSVLSLIRGLRELGVESEVWAPIEKHVDSRDSDPFRDAGFYVQHFQGFLPNIGMPARKRASLMALGGNIVSLDLFPRLLARSDIDIVHSHALGRIGGTARRAAQFRRLPFALSIHGGFLDLPKKVAEEFRRAHQHGVDLGKAVGLLVGSRRVPQDADVVFSVNSIEAGKLKSEYPRTRVVQVDNPVNFADSRPLPDDLSEHPFDGEPYMIMVARVAPTKRQRFAVDLFASLFRDGLLRRFVIVGGASDPAYEAEVRTEVEKLGLKNEVIFEGALDPKSDRLAQLYRHAHLATLPSDAETFGIVLLEALGYGIPVVASATSGAKEIAARHLGCKLFPIGDFNEAEKAAKDILSDASLRDKVRAQVDEIRRRYSDRSVAESILDHYRGWSAG